ncbi:MAG: VOC family protein, partial [Myxococcus sp.]|nr:VOC family protein [Myxococcus sp.]
APARRLGTRPFPPFPALFFFCVMHSRFSLSGALFAAMDAHASHPSTFTEGVSLQVRCADQPEIDAFWSKLTAGGAESQCGWCKDRFGVSWRVIPANIGGLLRSPSAVQAMLGMKKLDIAALERA